MEDKLKELLTITVDFWNKFDKLDKDKLHYLDQSELCRDIHDIQNRLYSIANRNGIVLTDK